jgi:hypothetical protein
MPKVHRNIPGLCALNNTRILLQNTIQFIRNEKKTAPLLSAAYVSLKNSANRGYVSSYFFLTRLVLSYPPCQQLATAYPYYHRLCVPRRHGFPRETTALIRIAKLGRRERVDTTISESDSCHWTCLSSGCSPVVLEQLLRCKLQLSSRFRVYLMRWPWSNSYSEGWCQCRFTGSVIGFIWGVN